VIKKKRLFYHKFPVLKQKKLAKSEEKLKIHQKLPNYLQQEKVLKVFLSS